MSELRRDLIMIPRQFAFLPPQDVATAPHDKLNGWLQ